MDRDETPDRSVSKICSNFLNNSSDIESTFGSGSFLIVSKKKQQRIDIEKIQFDYVNILLLFSLDLGVGVLDFF